MSIIPKQSSVEVTPRLIEKGCGSSTAPIKEEEFSEDSEGCDLIPA